jgi:hypothetical protein
VDPLAGVLQFNYIGSQRHGILDDTPLECAGAVNETQQLVAAGANAASVVFRHGVQREKAMALFKASPEHVHLG